MKSAFIIVLGIILASSVNAQVSPAEAAAKLADRTRQQKAERAEIVQITAGELADLKNRVRQLEGELSTYRAKTAEKPKPLPTMIEIGMTKAEVMDYVKRKGLHIAGMSADAGVRKSSEQVTVRGTSSINKDQTVNKNDESPNRKTNQTDTNGTSKVEMDVVVKAGVQETITLQKIQTYRVVVGTGSGGLGGPENVYGSESRVTGTIIVHLTDGLVTAVNAQ